MTHNGESRGYEVALGPAAIRARDGLFDPADWDDLEYALRTELVDGPNADKESSFDREGQPVSEHSADSGDVVYTATPLSFQAYTAVHRGLSKHAMIASLLEAFGVIEELLPRWSVLGSILDRGQLLEPRQRSCGVGQDYVVIDQRGRVAKCHMEIERTLGDVFRDDPLQLVRKDLALVQNPAVTEKRRLPRLHLALLVFRRVRPGNVQGHRPVRHQVTQLQHL